MSEQNRITHLEEEVAHLRLTNEELSGELHNQWKRIEALEKYIKTLETRVTGIQDSLDNPTENERPPHW